MTITGSSDSSNSWDDLEKVRVNQTARMNNVSGSPTLHRKLPDIDLQRSDTLSLGTNEAAELVALEIHNFDGYTDNNNYGNNFNFRHAMTLALNYDDLAWRQNNDIETDNVDADGEISGRTRIDDTGRVLWMGESTFQHVDQGGGNTKADSGSDVPTLINYRDTFGQGPMVDNDDSLTHAGYYNIVNAPLNSNLVQKVTWTAHFDVFEYDTSYGR